MESPENPCANPKNWEDLAKEAAHESDPEKLLTIVQELCSVLDAQHKAHANTQSQNGQPQETSEQHRSISKITPLGSPNST